VTSARSVHSERKGLAIESRNDRIVEALSVKGREGNTETLERLGVEVPPGS